MRFVSRDYVVGGIYLWTGSIATIPGTFRLCDGSLGTPDLRNKFIVGAGDSYVPTAGGGSINHTHPFTGYGHIHSLDVGADLAFGSDQKFRTNLDASSGTTDNSDVRPPYHSLAYIMYAGRIH